MRWIVDQCVPMVGAWCSGFCFCCALVNWSLVCCMVALLSGMMIRCVNKSIFRLVSGAVVNLCLTELKPSVLSRSAVSTSIVAVVPLCVCVSLFT